MWGRSWPCGGCSTRGRTDRPLSAGEGTIREHQRRRTALAGEHESSTVVEPGDPFALLFAERDDVTHRRRHGVIDPAGRRVGRVDEHLAVRANGEEASVR